MTALRLRYLSLALSLGGMLAATPKLVLAQDSRTAIESQYKQLAEAIGRNDVEGILALQAPEFSSRNPNGSAFDFAAMERYTRRLAAAVDSVIHIRNVIRSFDERGDTSVADVCQEFSRSNGSATTGATESIPACCSARPGSTWQTAGSAST